MRPAHARLLALATMMALAVLLTAARAPLTGNSELMAASPSEAVKGSGCVEQGVEAGCLVVRDFKSHKLYNLFFEGEKPGLDTAISFEGDVHDGPTICMQGQPVQVKTWTPLRMKCPGPSEKEKKTKGGKAQMTSKEPGKCSNWAAWHDRMPGKPATLHVTGECEFPTSGFSVELKPRVPQGTNPAIYMLDRIVHAPSGVTNPVITKVPVHYTEKTDKKYESIQILPDQVTVPVKEVS